MLRLRTRRCFTSSLILFLVVLILVQCFIEFRHFLSTKSTEPVYFNISCEKILRKESSELEKARKFVNQDKQFLIPDENFIFSPNRCENYRKTRFDQWFHQNDSETNRNFPIAFTIFSQNSAEQFDRLLRLIYRPQNFYCVQVDLDCSQTFRTAIESIVQCFSNVFLSSSQQSFSFHTASRLKAQLLCMKDHLRHSRWKYLLNIDSSMLPLKSNTEIVKILSSYRGFNDIQGQWKTRQNFKTKYQWVRNTATHAALNNKQWIRTSIEKSEPPGKVQLVKGSVHGSNFSVCFHSKSKLENDFLLQEHFHGNLLNLYLKTLWFTNSSYGRATL